MMRKPPFLLVAVLALLSFESGAAAGDPRTSGTPPLNTALRLPVTSDMPEWAKLLYRDDIVVDVSAVDLAYAKWEAEAQSTPRAKWQEPYEARGEENRWEEYYRRWRRDVRAFERPDGSFDFSRTPADRASRHAATGGAQNVAGTGWSFLGPERVLMSANQNPSTPLMVQQSHVTCFDVALTNTSILYCGTESGVLLKTTNKGVSWTQLGTYNSLMTAPLTSIAVNPANANELYVASTWGIARSGDGGSVWTLDLNQPPFKANDLKVKPDSTAVVLAAGAQLKRRTSAGTWSTIVPRTSYDLEFRPGQPSVVYALVRNAAGNRCEFFKSTNGGLTFSIRQTGWPDTLGDGGGRLTVTPADPSRIYAVILTRFGPRVLRSHDSGESWVTIGSSSYTGLDGSCASGPLGMALGQGFYDLSIAASATDTSAVVVGTTTAYRTTNGGATWSALGGYCGPIVPIHPDIQEMKCVGGDSWMATDGGMTLSTDFWATNANASPRTEGLRGTQIWGMGMGWNEDVLIGAAYHNGVFSRTESFPAGTFGSLGGGEPASGYVNPFDARMVYYSAPCNFIIPRTPNEPYQIWFSSKYPNEGYVGMKYSEQAWDPRYSHTYYLGKLGAFWKTTDNGATFRKLFEHPDTNAWVEHIEVSRANPDVIYFTVRRSSTGELWKTTNGGVSWSPCAPPTGVPASQLIESTITMSGTDENVLWWVFRSSFGDEKVSKSTDGGQTWTNWGTPTLVGQTIMDAVHQLGSDGGVYLLCDDAFAFYRNNTMTDWIRCDTGLPWQLDSQQGRLGIHYKTGKLRIGSIVGFWEMDLLEPSTTTLVQPMTLKEGVCLGDTVQFDSYSVTNGSASYQWSFFPAPQWVSDPFARNPRVVFGTAPGPYSASLTITDANGQTTRTVRNIVGHGGAARWANQVLGFSSQYSAPAWAAQQALGPPDIYPTYGDFAETWASLSEDDQPEFLRLGFANPAPINFVQVIETFHPGALVKVSALNPGTNQLQTLWEGAASVQPAVARAFTARFPTTSFAVSDVRLDFDSPAVPGWNEVDAVGIGLDPCLQDLVGVTDPPITRPSGALRWTRPNPFARDLSIGFALQRRSAVRAEVFDIAGKRVRTLVDGTLDMGVHEATWDGRDHGGHDTAPGLYYLRLQVERTNESRKLVKLW